MFWSFSLPLISSQSGWLWSLHLQNFFFIFLIFFRLYLIWSRLPSRAFVPLCSSGFQIPNFEWISNFVISNSKHPHPRGLKVSQNSHLGDVWGEFLSLLDKNPPKYPRKTLGAEHPKPLIPFPTFGLACPSFWAYLRKLIIRFSSSSCCPLPTQLIKFHKSCPPSSHSWTGLVFCTICRPKKKKKNLQKIKKTSGRGRVFSSWHAGESLRDLIWAPGTSTKWPSPFDLLS